jgi:hypothetical protein
MKSRRRVNSAVGFLSPEYYAVANNHDLAHCRDIVLCPFGWADAESQIANTNARVYSNR